MCPRKPPKFKGEKRFEPGQAGLTALLDGDQMTIKPEGFDKLHERGGGQHTPQGPQQVETTGYRLR